MSEPKTKRTKESVAAFLDSIPDEGRRRDAKTVRSMMEQITKKKAAMWGTSIVGFDSYHYEYASGQEADWPVAAFSPRKSSLTIYIMPGFDEYGELMAKLGKYKTAKSCLYIKKLEDVHLPTLKALIRESVKRTRARAG